MADIKASFTFVEPSAVSDSINAVAASMFRCDAGKDVTFRDERLRAAEGPLHTCKTKLFILYGLLESIC